MNQQIQKPEPAQSLGKRKDLQEWMETDDFKYQIKRGLPQGMKAERFIRIAVTATIRNPKLLTCTPDSFFKCLHDLSGMGLEPDGRRAHLIPFRDNKANTTVCTMIVDYKGIAELVRRNGDVASIHCDVVGRNDVFVCRFGSGGKLEHIPNIEDRGTIYAAYSFVTLKNGAEEWDVMSLAEIQRIRDRSRSANDGPWVTDWSEMAKKTVFRRHSKTLPLSPDTRNAVEYGEDDEFEDRFAAAVPARAPRSNVLTDQLGDDGAAVEPPDEGKKQPPDGPPPPKESENRPTAAQMAPEKPQQAAAEKPKEPAKEKPKPAAAAPKQEEKKEPPPPADKPKPAAAKSSPKAVQLEELLAENKIAWIDFAKWISSLTGLPVAASPAELAPSVLADCVVNWPANHEAFDEWLKEVTV